MTPTIDHSKHAGSGLADQRPAAVQLAQLNPTQRRRAEAILQRITQFADPRNHTDESYGGVAYINKSSLTRTLWRAGQLCLSEVVEAIETLQQGQARDYGDPNLYHYSLAYALGRSGRTKALKLLDPLQAMLPNYLYQALRHRLSPTPVPIPSSAWCSLPAAIAELSDYQRARTRRLHPAAEAERAYAHQVLALHGLETPVKQCLAQLQLQQLEQADWLSLLPPSITERLNLNTAYAPELAQAIRDIQQAQQRATLEAEQAKLAPSYQQLCALLKVLDLSPLGLSAEQHALLKAGQTHPLNRQQRRKLLDLLHQLPQLDNATLLLSQANDWLTRERIKPAVLSPLRQDISETLLRQAGLDPQRVNEPLPMSLRCQLESDLSGLIRRLIEHRFWQLRQQHAEQEQQRLSHIEQQLVWLFLAAQHHASQARAELHRLIDTLPLTRLFIPTFRQLYKLAEIDDDYPTLARLNRRIEQHYRLGSKAQQPQDALSPRTLAHFRQRPVRFATHLAKDHPQAYPAFAKAFLLLMDDRETLTTEHQSHLCQYLLRANSTRWRANYAKHWYLAAPKQHEAEHPEAHPECWHGAGDTLFELLRHSQSGLVNDFALKRLQSEPKHCQSQALSTWIALLESAYDNTVQWAASWLKDSIEHPEVLAALLRCRIESVQQSALSQLSEQNLKQQPSLLLTLLCSPQPAAEQRAQQLLQTQTLEWPSLCQELLAHWQRLPTDEQALAVAALEYHLTRRPLKAQVPLKTLAKLSQHPSEQGQHLASVLLQDSPHAPAALAQTLLPLSDKAIPALRKQLLVTLQQQPAEQYTSAYQALMINALVDHDASVRHSAYQVLLSVTEPHRLEAVWDKVVPYLFQSEPVEGFAADMRRVVHALAGIYSNTDKDLVWRLLCARGTLANEVGKQLLSAHGAQAFSVKQLARLTHSPDSALRQFALQALIDAPQRLKQAPSAACLLLKSPWPESRQAAIALLSNTTDFDEPFWQAEQLLWVCDQAHPEVQAFGRALLQRRLEQGEGLAYLTHLSQHPSLAMQSLLARFLNDYAADQGERLQALLPWFRQVLMQVNQARQLKNHLLAFLHQQANRHPSLQPALVELLNEQALTEVKRDRERYVQALYQLQSSAAVTDDDTTRLRVVEPTLRQPRLKEPT